MAEFLSIVLVGMFLLLLIFLIILHAVLSMLKNDFNEKLNHEITNLRAELLGGFTAGFDQYRDGLISREDRKSNE